MVTPRKTPEQSSNQPNDEVVTRESYPKLSRRDFLRRLAEAGTVAVVGRLAPKYTIDNIFGSPSEVANEEGSARQRVESFNKVMGMVASSKTLEEFKDNTELLKGWLIFNGMEFYGKGRSLDDFPARMICHYLYGEGKSFEVSAFYRKTLQEIYPNLTLNDVTRKHLEALFTNSPKETIQIGGEEIAIRRLVATRLYKDGSSAPGPAAWPGISSALNRFTAELRGNLVGNFPIGQSEHRVYIVKDPYMSFIDYYDWDQGQFSRIRITVSSAIAMTVEKMNQVLGIDINPTLVSLFGEKWQDAEWAKESVLSFQHHQLGVKLGRAGLAHAFPVFGSLSCSGEIQVTDEPLPPERAIPLGVDRDANRSGYSGKDELPTIIK